MAYDPTNTTINKKIGYNTLFLIFVLKVINTQNIAVAPADISNCVINIIIFPTPDIIPYLAGLLAIHVIPSYDAIQKFFPLNAI